MPRPKSERKMVTVTIRIYEDNKKFIEDFYSCGYNKVIRTLTDEHCNKVQSFIKNQQTKPIKVDLGDLVWKNEKK